MYMEGYDNIDWETSSGEKVKDVKSRNKACEGKIDIISHEPILKDDGVELDKQCYSKKSLNNYFDSVGRQNAVIPHNRRPMTIDDFDNMHYGGRIMKKRRNTMKRINTKKRISKKQKTTLRKKQINMKGGFSPVQDGWILSHGITQEQLNQIIESGIEFEDLVTIINNIAEENEHINSDAFALLIMNAVNNRGNISDLSSISRNSSVHSLESNGPLRLSDLEVSTDSDEGYTTRESIEPDEEDLWGGKKKRKVSHKKSTKRKTKKTHKKRTRKNRHLKGGMCYGNGVGANSYDPNFSIYNTRELQLFPYRPAN